MNARDTTTLPASSHLRTARPSTAPAPDDRPRAPVLTLRLANKDRNDREAVIQELEDALMKARAGRFTGLAFTLTGAGKPYMRIAGTLANPAEASLALQKMNLGLLVSGGLRD